MSKTGYPLIQSKMDEAGAQLGGEMSGHIYFADNYYGFDDGIFASLRLLEILSREKKPISDLLSDIPLYHSTPEIRIKSKEEEKFRIIAELKEDFSKTYEIIDIDGIRVKVKDGWFLVRASNTQPILVLRFEAKTIQRLEEIKDMVKNKLKAYPSLDLNF